MSNPQNWSSLAGSVNEYSEGQLAILGSSASAGVTKVLLVADQRKKWSFFFTQMHTFNRGGLLSDGWATSSVYTFGFLKRFKGAKEGIIIRLLS